VDYRGALKVYDAIEQTSSKPRLVLVSAIDIRDKSKGYPAHYVRFGFVPLFSDQSS